MDLSPLMTAAIGALATAITAAITAAIPLLPRAYRALQVYVNGADATLVNRALDNAAELALQHVRDGVPIEAAVEDMVEYVWKAMPKALKRLGTNRKTLETMANGTLARLMAGRE